MKKESTLILTSNSDAEWSPHMSTQSDKATSLSSQHVESNNCFAFCGESDDPASHFQSLSLSQAPSIKLQQPSMVENEDSERWRYVSNDSEDPATNDVISPCLMVRKVSLEPKAPPSIEVSDTSSVGSGDSSPSTDSSRQKRRRNRSSTNFPCDDLAPKTHKRRRLHHERSRALMATDFDDIFSQIAMAGEL